MRVSASSCLCSALLVTLTACGRAPDALSPAVPFVRDGQASSEQSVNVGHTVRFFKSSFVFGGKPFTYTMVGSNPFTAPSTVTIPTVIIPVELRFGSVIFDPTTAVREIQQSPIFNPGTPYPAGRLQYGDAVMRSEFWSFVHANNNYHVLLEKPLVRTAHLLTITSSAQGFIGTTSGVRTAFLHSQYFLDPHGIEQQLLAQYKVTPDTLTIFALTDTRMLEESGNCCYNGYHTSFTVSTATGLSTFTTVWGNVSAESPLDLSHVSHEVAEWLNDPFYSPPAVLPTSAAQFNRVPTWIHPVTKTCLSNELEVGDPLVKAHFTVNDGVNTFTVQDIAFLSWFSRSKPSIGIGGRYDLLGALAPQTGACPS